MQHLSHYSTGAFYFSIPDTSSSSLPSLAGGLGFSFIITATPSYEPFDRQKIITVNKKNTIRHAYFREYFALQTLCLLILQHQKHQIGTGSNQIYGILFDGSWLWEEYIYSLVSDIFYHPMNKKRKEGQRLFSDNTGLIYPDFISHNCENRIIADAKYKPIGNISNRDYLQVLAYMFRFNAGTGYYFYPESGESENKVLYLNEGSSYENNVQARPGIRLIKDGLKIPKESENYDSFSAIMSERETEFRKKLGEQIETI